MARNSYRILILSDTGETRLQLHLKRRMLYLALMFLALLCLSYGAMWRYAATREPPKPMPYRTLHSEYAYQALNNVFPAAREIFSMGIELRRVHDFNDKLRIMFNQTDDGEDDSDTVCEQGLSYDPLTNALMQGRPAPAGRLISRMADSYVRDIGVLEVEQQQLLLAIRSQIHELHLMPSIWPVEGVVTSTFSWRTHPITGRREFHNALDISAPARTPVYAPAAGTVTFVGWDGAYGRLIKIQHNDRISTRFAHLSGFNVAEGDQVVRSQLLGFVGSSGSATGPHLHYEVRINNKPVNPRNYILN